MSVAREVGKLSSTHQIIAGVSHIYSRISFVENNSENNKTHISLNVFSYCWGVQQKQDGRFKLC